MFDPFAAEGEKALGRAVDLTRDDLISHGVLMEISNLRQHLRTEERNFYGIKTDVEHNSSY